MPGSPCPIPTCAPAVPTATQMGSRLLRRNRDFVSEIKRAFSPDEIGNYAVHLERTEALSASQRPAIRGDLINIDANPPKLQNE